MKLLVLFAAVVMAAPSCGGYDDEGCPTPTPTATPTATPSVMPDEDVGGGGDGNCTEEPTDG